MVCSFKSKVMYLILFFKMCYNYSQLLFLISYIFLDSGRGWPVHYFVKLLIDRQTDKNIMGHM